MIKNTAGQDVGAQIVDASDGSAFTGTVTVYITGDGGTQAIGTVGSGVCTHEGNGFHSYAPSQAETNYDHVAFTFVGTGAIPVTMQVYTVSADINVTHWGGTAVGSVTLPANVTQISGDSTAADNAESFFDGTGYAGTNNVIPAVTTVTTVTNLTNAPTSGDLTATMKASVNTEIDTALADIHLDHLLATTYDPASKPGAADALLNELVENDGGVARYSANALEQAPSGTGASAVSIREEIDANSTQLAAIVADTNELQTDWANGGRLDLLIDALPTAAAIADAVWDEATAGHVTAGSYGASVLMIGVGYRWTRSGGTSTYDDTTVTRAS
jgi:hypothetical protein